MYYVKRLLLLFAICIAPFAALASLPAPVHAASLALSPGNGTVGSTTVITGSEFTGDLATIYWDNQIIERNIPISAAGALSHELVIPNAAKGPHIIRVNDDSNWAANDVTASFAVTPEVHCHPDVAREWTPITVSGKGFQSKEEGITITIDGEPLLLSPVSADADGSWTAQYTVPAEYLGIHTLSAFGSTTTEAEIGGIDLIVSPWMTLEPVSGPVGSPMIIEAWGFRHNEDGISLAWDNDIFFMNIRAEADGSILCDGSLRPHGDTLHDGKYRPTILVPESPAGKHILVLYGSSFTPKGTFPEYEFEVLTNLVNNPSRGKVGTRIEITGTGFAAEEAVTLKWDDTIIDDSLSADNKGSFITVFTAPQTPGSSHKITAAGSAGHSAQADFTVEGTTSVELSLVAPASGTSYTLFNSVGSVIISSFKYLTGIFSYLDGKPVDYPHSSEITFHWQGGGLQGSTYILQVAPDGDPSHPVIEREIHNAESYSLTSSEMIPGGMYSWRVMSIDDRGIESPWSDTAQIEIISMPGRVVLLTWITIILVIAAVICALLFVWYYLRR